MSSVLVLLIIPERDYEEEVREKLRLSSKLTYKQQQQSNNNSNHSNQRKESHHLNTITENGGANLGGGANGGSDKLPEIEIQKNAADQQHYPMEKIVEEGLSYLGIQDAVWARSQNDRFYTITFPVELEDSDIVIQYFKTLGVGLRLDTSIGIIPFSLFCYNEEMNELEDAEIILENGDKDVSKSIGNFKEKQSKFLKSVTARLTVAQVVDNVRSNGSLTFDFVCYIVFASWIAAMGLLDNSVISLVASMLVSPMMGPVMCFTFGTIIKDFSLIKTGLKNILVCFAVTISFGYFFGLITLNFTDHWGDWAWPTDMMRERGLLRVVWIGTLVAFPSGCAVAISLLSGNEASLVGVAISVSLLPPSVNAGLHWAYATLRGLYAIGQTAQPYQSQFTNDTVWLRPALAPHDKYSVVYSDNMGIETLLLGLVSVLFSLVNITNIFLGALLLLKIKEIAPLATMSPENRRFFQEDIRIAREYNEKSRGSTSGNLGEDVLKEWAQIAGLDKDDLLKPESRAVRLQTLADIAKDVQADAVYQTVTRGISNHGPTADNLARRLSAAMLQHQAPPPPPSAHPPLNIASHLIRNDAIRGSLRSLRSMHSAPRTPIPHVVISDLEHSTSFAQIQQQQQQQNNRPPSSVGFNRRRISTVALNNFFDKQDQQHSDSHSNRGRSPPLSAGCLGGGGGGGILNSAFSFAEADINAHQHQLTADRSRRYSTALLRRTLHTAEHSPYSLWPSTRTAAATGAGTGAAARYGGSTDELAKFTVTPVAENYNGGGGGVKRLSIPQIGKLD